MALKIKNWSKFQHFKDRRPPWIKLYRDILDDKDWHALKGDSAKLLIMLWLIASENNGEIPAIEVLAFRLRISEKAVRASISELSPWLYQDDINMISGRYHGPQNQYQQLISKGLGETETETETEKEGECERERQPPVVTHDVTTPPPEGESVKRAKRFTPPTLQEITEYLKVSGKDAFVDAEAFHAFYESKGWLVGRVPMKSWKAAIVTWQKNRFVTSKAQEAPHWSEIQLPSTTK